MKFSIITINLNNKVGLQKTLDSIIMQSYSDYELIVIDGGSIDGSTEIILDYKDRIAYSVSEKDSGIYNAMNKGIKVAKGEWILFLNSGDVLFNDVVLADIVSYNPTSDIFYGNYYTSNGELRSGVDEDEVTMFTFMDYTIHHTGCSFIRRDLFRIYGLYDEKLEIVSDWKWFLQVVGLNNVSLEKVNVIVSIYDLSGISSVQVSKRIAEREKVIGEIVPMRVIRDYEKYNELLRSFVIQERKIRSSWSYRIGSFILKPIRLIKLINNKLFQ